MEPTSRVVTEDDCEWIEGSHGETFGGRGARLGAAAGSDKLGCSLYEVPSERSPVPYHYHTANEEALYVLEGNGTLRTEAGDVELSKGDYVSFPVGEDGAHQVFNSSNETLRYLCFPQ